MRSKEVDEVINQLIIDIEFSTTGCSTGIIDVTNIEKVLSYISDLEKENMGLLTRLKADSLINRDNYWRDKIRDKIEELEKENYVECIEFNLDVIEILKEILGE